jgi:hypothetical protein
MTSMAAKSALTCVLLATPVFTEAAEKTYPPPTPAKDTSGYGAKIPRTMALLATSTPEHRNHVRILVYGQSISAQEWSYAVERDLRARFPNADIEFANRSIGGFASQWLVRSAEQDLYPFYPDLMIFHVFGAHNTYEDIIANTRKRTTAEIAICTDHLAASEMPNAAGAYEDQGWTQFMMTFVPTVAEKYGCEIIDIRGAWKTYVMTNGIQPQALLKDGIHLNDWGNFLYAEIVKRQLVHNPDVPANNWRDLVKTYEVGRDIQWKHGRLTLDFEGNRVDAIAAVSTGGVARTTVRIDGQPPSAFDECFAFTCPSQGCGTWQPGIKRVSSKTLRIAEEWTARVTAFDPKTKVFEFEVTGSRTGQDGKGASDRTFVSDSGRVVIEADVRLPNLKPDTDWRMPGENDSGVVPVGFEVKWKCVPMFVATYEAPRIQVPTREVATTLVQGLCNGRHTLELKAEDGGAAPVRALRVYRPPCR